MFELINNKLLPCSSLAMKQRSIFRNKQEFAMQLIGEITSVIETTYILVDAWYISGKVMYHALKRGYHPIGRVKYPIE